MNRAYVHTAFQLLLIPYAPDMTPESRINGRNENECYIADGYCRWLQRISWYADRRDSRLRHHCQLISRAVFRSSKRQVSYIYIISANRSAIGPICLLSSSTTLVVQIEHSVGSVWPCVCLDNTFRTK